MKSLHLVSKSAFALILLCSASFAVADLAAPTLIAPANGTTLYNPQGGVLLQWQAVAGALVYEVSASHAVLPTSDLLWTFQTSHSYTRLQQGTWRWQVRGRTAFDEKDDKPAGEEGPWSAIRTYNIAYLTPTPTPAGFPNPDISGNDVMDVSDFYLFQKAWKVLPGDPDYAGLYTRKADLIADGVVNEKDLLQMIKAWNVRKADLVPAVQLLAPANGANLTFYQAMSPGFSWQPIDGIKAYHLLIENRNAEGKWIARTDRLLEDDVYSFPSTLAGDHRWKVRAQDPGSLLFGPWSEERSFTLR